MKVIINDGKKIIEYIQVDTETAYDGIFAKNINFDTDSYGVVYTIFFDNSNEYINSIKVSRYVDEIFFEIQNILDLKNSKALTVDVLGVFIFDGFTDAFSFCDLLHGNTHALNKL